MSTKVETMINNDVLSIEPSDLINVQFHRPSGTSSGLDLALKQRIETNDVIAFKYGKQGRMVKDIFRIFDTTIANAPRNRINNARKEAALKEAKAKGQDKATYDTITSYDVLRALAGTGNPEYAPNTFEAMKFGNALKAFLGYDNWIDLVDVQKCAARLTDQFVSEQNEYISISDVMSDTAMKSETNESPDTFEPQDSELLSNVIDQTLNS
jgi:hypothetical protein